MPNRVKELRKKKGVSQKALADDFNKFCKRQGFKVAPISLYVISKWETHTNDPTKATYKALAKYFNVDENFLRGAYSKKEINRLVMEAYQEFFSSYGNQNMALFVKPLNGWTIEQYLIAVGMIPYDTPKQAKLLTKEQTGNVEFWQKGLGQIYSNIAMQWLLKKPNLNASKEDVLKAVNSAMRDAIACSATSLAIDVMNVQALADHERLFMHQFVQKRSNYLLSHMYYENEIRPDGSIGQVPFYDFEHEHPLDGKAYTRDDLK